MSGEQSIYDSPHFVQPGLWGGEVRFYKFENNLGATIRIGGEDIVFQTIRYPNGGEMWEPATLHGVRSGPLHMLKQAEDLLAEIRDLPWGA